MTLTVQDLVTKFDEFEDDALIQVEYLGIRFPVDKVDNELGNVVLSIGQKSEHEESEDEESEESEDEE